MLRNLQPVKKSSVFSNWIFSTTKMSDMFSFGIIMFYNKIRKISFKKLQQWFSLSRYVQFFCDCANFNFKIRQQYCQIRQIVFIYSCICQFSATEIYETKSRWSILTIIWKIWVRKSKKIYYTQNFRMSLPTVIFYEGLSN